MVARRSGPLGRCRAIEDAGNEVMVSAATVWEIVIKKALGKLDAPDDFEAAVDACRFVRLPVTFAHALTVRDLPSVHRDPFDRMLVAQAIVEGLTLVTRDSNVLRYPVPSIEA